MHLKHIFRLIGVMLMFFSLSMLTPLIIHYYFEHMLGQAYLKSFIITFVCGLLFWSSCRKAYKEIQIHDGFLMVVLFWGLICLFATLPFAFMLNNPRFIDIFFECVSGLTTTGVTIFPYPEHLPKSLLFYRQQLQFLGGMSIIVLTVAIMPLLGVGGTRLYRTETPGALKDTKFTPRITQTAKALWSIYLLLTLTCFLFFWTCHLNWFDALCESFATISTGGLMAHHQGFGFYENTWIQWGAPLFMILGSINFGSHYLALKKRSLKTYWMEEEFRFYILVISLTLVLGSAIYFHYHQHLNLDQARYLYFSIISFMSTTGSVTTDYSHWPLSLVFICIMISMFGGCHGSTTGGFKMIRILILSKFYQRELKVLLHPQLISPLKYNNKPIETDILMSLMTYLISFIGLYIFLLLMMLLANYDFLTAISIVTGTLSNSGIGLGEVTNSFQQVSFITKFWAIIAMLAGRLEIFSLFIVFSLAYWKE